MGLCPAAPAGGHPLHPLWQTHMYAFAGQIEENRNTACESENANSPSASGHFLQEYFVFALRGSENRSCANGFQGMKSLGGVVGQSPTVLWFCRAFCCRYSLSGSYRAKPCGLYTSRKHTYVCLPIGVKGHDAPCRVVGQSPTVFLSYPLSRNNPAPHTAIPKSCRSVIVSLNSNSPRISRMHATDKFATNDAMLTFHPAR